MKKTVIIFLIWGTYFIPQIAFNQSRTTNKQTDLTLQLDTICKMYNIAIKEIALKNTKDTLTNIGVHKKSFLIYNTTSKAELTRGYYYWYSNKWNILKRIDKNIGVPISKGNAGDVYLDLSRRDVYFHNGTMWITKIIDDKDLTVVKYNSALGLLICKKSIDKDEYIPLYRLAPNFEKQSCISMNASRKTVNYIDNKGVLITLDLKLLRKKTETHVLK
ncbi:hypothetical protein [Flavobacterium branchiicola]|uniref:GLPGLI family protein n=1 Tax=Flavobacterium branchiicola TaxID=1114875 RepID=A0ABV9PN61_9FLAO|nr:hypothetical protein [Flavobacterium branchiicola]MBS7256772.1 hypothetical protein [Flavobacterium branchiicola]